MTLDDALACVKAAGFRVTKPNTKRRKQARVGPTCVTTFVDGTVCRMTTYTSDEKLDYARGEKLCRWAWSSRHGHDCVPPVASIHFEREGEQL
jgi:hypothetical protein